MQYYANGLNQAIEGTGEPLLVIIPANDQQWVGVAGGDCSSYHFQISEYPSFAGVIFDAIQNDDEFTGEVVVQADGIDLVALGNIFFFPNSLADKSVSSKTTYYWRVRGGSFDGVSHAWDEWSSTWQFQVNKPPGAVTITSIAGMTE